MELSENHMQIKLKKLLIFSTTLTLLAGCNPQKEYNNYILKQGYIPFIQPMADIGVGAFASGNFKQFVIDAPRATCFPAIYKDVPTELTSLSAIDMAQVAKSFTLEANLDANVLAANGTPIFTIKANAHKTKSVNVSIESASIEYINKFAFAEWVNTSISPACKTHLLKGGAFISQAIKVDKMSFQFLNQSGGQIELDANKVNEIIDFNAKVKWEISNKFTLSILTPKYIGFHIAKTAKDDPSTIGFVANTLKGDKFNYVPLQLK